MTPSPTNEVFRLLGIPEALAVLRALAPGPQTPESVRRALGEPPLPFYHVLFRLIERGLLDDQRQLHPLQITPLGVRALAAAEVLEGEG